MMDILLLLGGFVALVYGADKLVEAAASFAKNYKYQVSLLVLQLFLLAPLLPNLSSICLPRLKITAISF